MTGEHMPDEAVPTPRSRRASWLLGGGASVLAAAMTAVIALFTFLTVAAGFGADTSLDGDEKVVVGAVQLAALACAGGGLAAALRVVAGELRFLAVVVVCLGLALLLQDAAWDLGDRY